MAMKPKKISSSAKKPVKRMRGGGMVAMKEPVAMKKGGAVGSAASGGGATASSLAGGLSAGAIKKLVRQLGASALSKSNKFSRADVERMKEMMPSTGKLKGRGPK